MKWQTISGITHQLNEEAKSLYLRKLEKDASVEIPHLWSDFITDTHKHLHNSQSNLTVTNDEKTGSLTCLCSFDALHPDFLENNKPFIDYTLNKYDQRANSYLSGIKNPLTKKYLAQRIGDWRIQLASQISSTESRLIDGKRTHLAIESVEKLKNATYDNPELYANHLQDSAVAINSLSLLPQEKDKLLHEARQELAYSAALGVLRESPQVILNNANVNNSNNQTPSNTNNQASTSGNSSSDNNTDYPWIKHLTLEQRIKLYSQASTLLHHKQVMMQQQTNQLAKAHLASILKTGKGITGFDNILHASFSVDDPRFIQLKEQESLYKETFVIAEELKHSPLSKGKEILSKIAPRSGDLGFDKKEKIYNTLLQQYDQHLQQAQKDPAKFVEDLFSDEIPREMPLHQRYLLRKSLQGQKGIPSYNQKYLMNDERNDYLQRLHSPDPEKIKQQLDIISQFGSNDLHINTNSQLGIDILDEILQSEKAKDSRRLSALTHLYVESYLYKNHDLMNTAAQAISVQGQLFGELSDKDKKIIKKTISDSDSVNNFKHAMLVGQSHNMAEVNLKEETILNLARFYQKSKYMPAEDATKLAISELIDKAYIKPFDNKRFYEISSVYDLLHVPSSIIENGEIVELNKEHLNQNLTHLRKDIIQSNINYDLTSSFGIAQKGLEQEEVNKIRSVLQDGEFRLSPDKKSVYYVYFDQEQEYPLLKSPDVVLTIPLTSLNQAN